jgi:hypothetical protein
MLLHFHEGVNFTVCSAAVQIFSGNATSNPAGKSNHNYTELTFALIIRHMRHAAAHIIHVTISSLSVLHAFPREYSPRLPRHPTPATHSIWHTHSNRCEFSQRQSMQLLLLLSSPAWVYGCRRQLELLSAGGCWSCRL